MSSQPIISVGLPVWNGADFLEIAIQSVLAQTEPDLELIVSDNASTDATEEIVRRWMSRDSRVRYHRFPENQGASANHSKVVELSTGKYFRWQAHDDICQEDLARRCIEEHESSPEPLALVHTRVELIDEEGKVIGEDPTRLDTCSSLAARRVWSCLMNVHLGTPAYGVVNLDTLRRTRLIDRFASSDYVLFLELALIGKIRQLPDVLYQKRLCATRSMAAQATPEALFRWYGGSGKAPANEADVRWRVLKEYLVSVGKLCHGPGERASCYSAVLSAFYWRRIRNWLRLRHRLGLHRPSKANGSSARRRA